MSINILLTECMFVGMNCKKNILIHNYNVFSSKMPPLENKVKLQRFFAKLLCRVETVNHVTTQF